METQTTKLLPKQKLLICPTCNAQILILPDLAAMSKAIENHAKLHYTKGLKKAKLVNNLTQQLLLLIIENDPKLLPKRVWLLIESYFGIRRVLGVALDEEAADRWVTAKYIENPQGSYFHDTSSIVVGGSS